MQKKKIVLFSILILIIIGILALILIKPKKISPMKMTASAEYTTKIGETEYDITNAVLEPSEIVPTLSAGMIPVKWNGESWIIADKNDWYDYSKGNSAYMMLSDGYYKSELERGIEEEQLASKLVGADVSVRPEDLGSIYVWVPRYAYNKDGEILYIKQTCSVAGTWEIPEIFMYETNNVDLSLAGIWVEYNPLENEDEVNSKIEEMNKEDNRYGLIANTIATNANNEATYKTTIETFIANTVGADASRRPLFEPSNSNRTILKIINTNKLEPIRGNATLNEEELKITIDVTYNTNPITKIIDINNRVISESSNVAEEKLSEATICEYIAIDNKGNMKKIELDNKNIFVISNVERLVEFRNRVDAGENFEGITVLQVADIDMSTVCSEALGSWNPIGYYDYNKPKDTISFNGTYNRNVSYNK